MIFPSECFLPWPIAWEKVSCKQGRAPCSLHSEEGAEIAAMVISADLVFCQVKSEKKRKGKPSLDGRWKSHFTEGRMEDLLCQMEDNNDSTELSLWGTPPWWGFLAYCSTNRGQTAARQTSPSYAESHDGAANTGTCGDTCKVLFPLVKKSKTKAFPQAFTWLSMLHTEASEKHCKYLLPIELTFVKFFSLFRNSLHNYNYPMYWAAILLL